MPFMIEFRLRQAAERRGIKTPVQLARAMATSEHREMNKKDEVVAGRYWEGTRQPTLATVEKFLKALKGCEIGELLVYKADKSLPAKAVRKRR